MGQRNVKFEVKKLSERSFLQSLNKTSGGLRQTVLKQKPKQKGKKSRIEKGEEEGTDAYCLFPSSPVLEMSLFVRA